MNECIVGCREINGSRVIAKNRDRTYDADVALVHHVSNGLEYLILLDPKTRYVEGINATTGIAIMNVALMNGTDFAGAASSEGKNIFAALLQAKSPVHAAKMLTRKKQEVYGSTMIVGPKDFLLLEFVPDEEPKCSRYSAKKFPVVRTNHSEDIKNGGYTPADGDDYISSKIRHAVAEVMFQEADTPEKVLDSLNYSVFGDHSSYDTNRQTSGMRTCSQMAIDVKNNKVYFRPIPGHGNLLGVYRTGDKSVEPKLKVEILDYNEPVSVPFETWQSGIKKMSEGFDLARYLDPSDKYDDDSFLSDIEKADIENIDTDHGVQKYIDKENEIIRMIVSLQNLLQKPDAGMNHLMKDRDIESDHQYLTGMLDSAESSTMDLYNLKSALRSKQNEAAKRVPRKKGQKKGSSKHSDLYTDENPKGTIKGLKFATVKDAESSVNKIKRSGRAHAHKVQAAVAMEQRAKAAGKKSAAGVYRSYINSVKKESVKSRESLMTEISKLPKEYFSKIDSAIMKSDFWNQENSVESIDAGPKGSLQSPAAYKLETALQDAFDDLGLDIDAYVSTFDTDDESFQLNPGHPAYPNRWLIDAKWYVSKQRPGRNTVDLQIMPFGDAADPSDVNSGALVRHIAQTVRHELVHYTQMKKQSLKKGLYSDIEAFEDMLKDPKQVPDEDNPKYWEVYEPTGNLNSEGGEEIRKEGFNQELYTQDYLKSHIEIDAHAHDAAEELLALHGLKGSINLLSGEIDYNDPKIPNALQHYLQHLPADGKTVRLLKKKIVAYLEHFAG